MTARLSSTGGKKYTNAPRHTHLLVAQLQQVAHQQGEADIAHAPPPASACALSKGSGYRGCGKLTRGLTCVSQVYFVFVFVFVFIFALLLPALSAKSCILWGPALLDDIVPSTVQKPIPLPRTLFADAVGGARNRGCSSVSNFFCCARRRQPPPPPSDPFVQRAGALVAHECTY